MKLYTKITIGLVAGILLGWVLNTWYDGDPFDQADTDHNGLLSVSEIIQSDLTRYQNIAHNKVVAPDNGKPGFKNIWFYENRKKQDYLEIAFPNVDLDKNGSLSLSEIISKGGDYATYYGNSSNFNRADTSRDGGLSLGELQLAGSKMTPVNREKKFNMGDVNRDGNLSLAEIVAQGMNYPDFVERASFYQADYGGDSLLSMEEYAWANINPEPYLNKDEFAKADINGDFVLSRNEDKSVRGMQRLTAYTDPVGSIFIRLVKMVVVPLILASLILGAANLGDIRKLGAIGLKAFGFFMLTTAVAVSIGVLAANIFRPGDGLPEQKKMELLQQFQKTTDLKVSKVTSGPQPSEFDKIVKIVVEMVPTNPIKSLAQGDMLAIIFFALFTGLCLTMIPGERAEAFIKTMDGLNEVVLKMVMLAMETAPYGVFALIVGVVADMGIDILLPLTKYGAVVVGALLVHVGLTHFSFITFYLKLNPIKFLRAIKEAILLGFSTSSSSATLPISMNVAQKNLNISNEVSSFVLPLGATINMDGTALYQGVAAIFIAQVYGIELAMSEQLLMVLTATLASIGAAGVPGAGMITLAVVLGTAGIPLEGIALIFGLDRILDMFRTTINITGDITCAAVMAKSSGETVEIHKDKDMIPG